jgi:hypothetical protein
VLPITTKPRSTARSSVSGNELRNGVALAELERRTASQDLIGARRARMSVAEQQPSSLAERAPLHHVFVLRRRPILTGLRRRLVLRRRCPFPVALAHRRIDSIDPNEQQLGELADYRRCFDAATIHAGCDGYSAGATIDLALGERRLVECTGRPAPLSECPVEAEAEVGGDQALGRSGVGRGTRSARRSSHCTGSRSRKRACTPPARASLVRKQSEGKSRREALPCLKRQLARTGLERGRFTSGGECVGAARRLSPCRRSSRSARRRG